MDAKEAIEEAAEEVSEETAEPAQEENVDGARAAARAEREAQKAAVRADKEAKKRAARDAKAERKAERRRRREERRKRRTRERAEAAEKRRAEAEKTKAGAKKAEARPRAMAESSAAAEPKAPAKAKPERPARDTPKAERPGAGAALKGAGSKVNAALTGPRARRAATRVDGGIQSAWKLLLAGLATLLAGALIIARFVMGGLRELGSLWLRVAEVLGEGILWVYRRLRPLVLAALRAMRAAVRAAERAVTPERAVALVVIAAAGALAASQFVDYRGVRIGAPEYAGIEAVAPAPQTDRAPTGSVHGYAMVPVAAVIIAAALLALRGRWRMARIIPLLAGLAIAVTLLLDARKGLDEGDAAVAYQGAQAVLIEGFWLQLSSAFVLLVTGLLLGHYARTSGAHERRRRPSGDGRDSGSGRGPTERKRRRFGIAGVRA